MNRRRVPNKRWESSWRTSNDGLLPGILGVEEAQAELLKGYLGEGKPDHILYDRLARARLFYVLILMKIVVRRVPLYKKEWAVMTARMIEQAAQALHKTVEV